MESRDERSCPRRPSAARSFFRSRCRGASVPAHRRRSDDFGAGSVRRRKASPAVTSVTPFASHSSMHWRSSHIPFTFFRKQILPPTPPRFVKFCDARVVGDARSIEHRTHQRPGAGADERPVVAGRGNRSDRRGGIVAGGNDHFGILERRKVPQDRLGDFRRSCRWRQFVEQRRDSSPAASNTSLLHR